MKRAISQRGPSAQPMSRPVGIDEHVGVVGPVEIVINNPAKAEREAGPWPTLNRVEQVDGTVADRIEVSLYTRLTYPSPLLATNERICHTPCMKTAVKNPKTSVNISLPTNQRQFVEHKVSTGGYSTVSEYFRELVRQDEQREAEARLESLLLQVVLPIVFVRNFVVLKENQTVAQVLKCQAYLSWIFLFLSLSCGMIFYWASAKFVKLVCGGKEVSFFWNKVRHKEKFRSEKWFENWRDVSIVGAVSFFILGLIFSLWFFGSL
jgi:putative addiction module CopG family antidote